MKLFYRGTTFTVQPASVSVTKASVTSHHELIYRGQTCNYDRPVAQPSSSKAVNWRFAAVFRLPAPAVAIA